MDVTIALERYDALIRAERDATMLKRIIRERGTDYGTLKYEELRLLHSLVNGEEKADA